MRLTLDVGSQLDHGLTMFESPPGNAIAVGDEGKAGELAGVERAGCGSKGRSVVDVEAEDGAAVLGRDDGGGAVGTDGQRRHGHILVIAR
jgi:uncharacterized protein with beta-barrel porin domain